jgi:DNA-binding NarL/FixJ family response regulator
MSIRILLVDDHRLILQGLRALLQQEADFEIVGEAMDGRTAIDKVAELQPDVIVMDLQMPELHGVEATRRAMSLQKHIKVIGLSARADPQATREMLSAGARGYVVKQAAFEELVQAIRSVANDEIYLSPSVADNIALNDSGSNGGRRTFSLSPREREVMQLLAEGKSTKEAAACLHVSPKTVETHRRNLMEKIHVESIAELTKYAIREGITSM